MSQIQFPKIGPIEQLSQIQKGKTESAGGDFKQVLNDTLKEVEASQKSSDQQIQSLLSGDAGDVHSAMVALKKAELSFQLMMQVRNKLIEAYHEVSRMQV